MGAFGLEYMMVAMFLGILMLGMVLSRYRVSLMVLLIPFAATCIVQLAGFLAAGKWKRLIFLLLSVVFICFWTARPLPLDRPLIRSSYYSSVYSSYYSRLALIAIKSEDWEQVAVIMTSSLVYQPELVKQLGKDRPVTSRHEASLADLYGRVHQRIAEVP